MKKQILFTAISSLISATIFGTAYGTAIVESGGLIYNSPGASDLLWNISNISYTLNSGQAIYNTDDYTLDSNNNRIYNNIVTDTQRTWDEQPVNVLVNNQNVATAQTTSAEEIVENNANVQSDGEGVPINASTASTLNRTFKLEEKLDAYQITVSYLLFGTISINDPSSEWGDIYHHAFIGLYGQDNDTPLIYDLFTSDQTGFLTGTLSIQYNLESSVEYTIQTHLYNSATGYSAATVPEPTTMLLFGTGLAGLAAVGRRRRK